MLLNLFSGSLFLLPILVTLGVYVGVENQKVIKVVQGKPPPGVNPDGTRRIIKDEQYCQKAYGIEPFPYRYICEYLLSIQSYRFTLAIPRDMGCIIFPWSNLRPH